MKRALIEADNRIRKCSKAVHQQVVGGGGGGGRKPSAEASPVTGN